MKEQKSSIKFFILFLISIILFITAIVWFNALAKRTHFNSEYVLGNSPGNLNNKGLFCEYKDKVYFSNPYDNNALYVMDSDERNIKLLNSDHVYGLNVYGNYIYYNRDNKEKNSGFGFLNINTNSLCRTTLNGKNLKILDEAPSQYPALIGNFVYYQHNDDTNGTSFYRIKIDGTKMECLNKNPINPSAISKNGIYYSNVVDNLFMENFDPMTKMSSTIFSGDTYFLIPDEDYIYFINCDKNYTLYRYNLTTAQAEPVTSERVDCYNISGNYIYYQTAIKNNYGLYRCEKDGSNPTLISEGTYTNINVTSKKIYFQKFRQETPVYSIPADGNLEISTFQP